MNAETIDSKASELWTRTLAIFNSTLQTSEEKNTAARYFEMITKVELNDTDFVLYTLNQGSADWLQEKYANKLKLSSILAGADQNITFLFKIDSNTGLNEIFPVVTKPVETNEQKTVSTFKSTVPLQSDYTFSEFVQGPSNSFAYNAAKAVAEHPGQRSFYNPLFIHGGTGLGKTHLMQAIGNHLKRSNPSLAICYLSAEIFLNEYINSLSTGQISAFRYKYRNVDVLLIDDVQFLHRGKENFQEEFFNTFNYLQQSHKQIVMTSDVAPKNLPAIEERLTSRFQGGMVQEIESPSYETRLAILRKKAQSMDIQISDSVLEFIADNIKSHVRAMEGALVKVSIVKNSDPTIILDNQRLAYILKDFIEKEQTMRNLTIEEIQAVVSKKYNITLDQMLSPERTSSLVTPRQLAMFICRKLTSKSLEEIAIKFEKKHATILHGVKSIKMRLENEVELKNSLDEILSELGCKISDTIDS